MQENNPHNVDLILQKVMMLAQVEKDYELAELFNVKAGTISAWRKRNTINYNQLIELCQKKGWDLNYILTDNNGNLNGNPNGNLKPKVQQKVAIKGEGNQGDIISIGKSKIGEYKKVISNSKELQSELNNYRNTINKLQNTIKEKDYKIHIQELDIAKLQGQVELLKSMLNK
jgi:hypothetical protein